MASEFLELLSQINDPRRGQGKKWQLGPILLVTILAVLSGATSYRKVHGFIKAHRKRLNKAFGFSWKSAPAYSAVRTILRGLDGGDVERIFRAHAIHLGVDAASADADRLAVVAIDGKALRHSFDAFNDQKAAHVLSAFSVDDALILGHLEVDEKSNEIPAAQDLIEALALQGRLYTMDAMHCQKTFEAAQKTNSHVLVQVKENQPSLLQIIERVAGTDTALSSFESFDDKRRSREESRKVDVFDASPALKNTDWDGLIVRVIKVTRTTLLRRAKDRSWGLRLDISYYACSAPIAAKKAADAIRGHWGIENRNHYVRDVAMLEDASRIRKNPGIFARARSFALNILRANGEDNISQAMWDNVLDITRPLKYRFM